MQYDVMMLHWGEFLLALWSCDYANCLCVQASHKRLSSGITSDWSAMGGYSQRNEGAVHTRGGAVAHNVAGHGQSRQRRQRRNPARPRAGQELETSRAAGPVPVAYENGGLLGHGAAKVQHLLTPRPHICPRSRVASTRLRPASRPPLRLQSGNSGSSHASCNARRIPSAAWTLDLARSTSSGCFRVDIPDGRQRTSRLAAAGPSARPLSCSTPCRVRRRSGGRSPGSHPGLYRRQPSQVSRNGAIGNAGSRCTLCYTVLHCSTKRRKLAAVHFTPGLNDAPADGHQRAVPLHGLGNAPAGEHMRMLPSFKAGGTMSGQGGAGHAAPAPLGGPPRSQKRPDPWALLPAPRPGLKSAATPDDAN